MSERKNSNIRNALIAIAVTGIGGFFAFIAKTQYDIASSLRDMNNDNRIQWEMIKEISQDMRNRRVDIEVTKTIQNQVILPTIFGETNEKKLTQKMHTLEKKEELKKLSDMPEQRVKDITQQLNSAKIYSKESLDGNVQHYINAQKKIRKK